ncbi:polygalacturonase [Gemmatimonadetes bacterium T265]|nr:polygalacturonase [Gemmatimonadetes bacterium T265]
MSSHHAPSAYSSGVFASGADDLVRDPGLSPPAPAMIDRRAFLGRAASAAGLVLLPGARAIGGAPAAQPRTFDALRYGAKGDGITDDAAAIQRAVDACAAAGGGEVTLPPGRVYLSGTVSLKSHVTLRVEPGATLRATGSREGFRALGALIFAKDAVNVGVTGGGLIDGNFHAYLTTRGEGGYNVTHPFLGPYDPLYPLPATFHPDGRPRIILMVGCRDVRLHAFTIRDAPTWTVHPIGCEDLWIEGITIDNSLLVPNCDGIDVDHCRNVRIANCRISAGDDCIILKASRNFPQYGPCENVTVTGCTLVSSSAAIKVEPEGPDAVRNAVVADCTITNSNRGIAVLNRDGATVENIVCSNLVIDTALRHAMWWGVGEPVHVSNLPRDKATKPGVVRGLQFNNIVAHGESGLFVHGWSDSPVADVVFDNVQLTVRRVSQYACGQYDLRPNDDYQGLYRHRIAGVYAKWASDLTLRDVRVRWADGLPDCYGPALEAEGVRGLALENFAGRGAHATDPAQLIDGVGR